MDAAVYAERKAEKLAAIFDAAERIQDLAEDMAKGPAHTAITNAAARLRTAADQIGKLGDGLRPYSEPGFYAELVPSLAKEDQGKHAANALEYVFSE